MAFVSYDSYKNRIEKLARFKNFVLKYKFLFIGLFAVIIAGISTLLAMKGTVTSAMILDATYTYGESYAPSGASAFLSGVTYEYSLKGTDGWTEEKPVKAGKYLARTVTRKAIGKGYGDPVEFEIVPKEIEFVLKEGQTVTYGDTPKYTVSGLVDAYSDRIEGFDFDYVYHTPDDGDWTVDVTLNAGGIRIVDKNGNDSSDCYVYDTANGNFALAKRSVSVALKRSSAEYCGTAISYEGEIADATKSKLAFDDKIEFVTSITQNGSATTLLNAGGYDINVVENTVKILSGSTDVTKFYNIESYAGGTFTVNKRLVTVQSDSNEWTYDGAEHSENGYKITGGSLAPNQRIEITPQTTVKNYKYSGDPNYFNYAVYDASGNTVTGNYDITPVYGTLKINKRPLTISTADGEWTYNGYAHSTNKAYELTGALADGQRLEVLSYAEVTNYTAGTTNTLVYAIYDGYEDVTFNYAVTERFGTLRINKLAITVNTGTDSFEYNGDPQSVDYDKINLLTLITGGSLALSSHSLEVKGTPATVTNVADTKNANNTTQFKVVSGIGDESENYFVNYVYGTLTVTPRPITVVIDKAEKVYDGTPLSSTAYTTRYFGATESGLLNGDKLTPVQSTINSITNAGGIQNTVEFTANDNYQIISYDRDNATLKVTPRPITVVIGYAEKVYDGTPLSSTAYTTHYYGTTASGLLNGDKLTPVQSTINSITNVGRTKNLVEFTASSNYEIKSYDRPDLNLRVTQREVAFKLNDIGEVTYGDTVAYTYGNEEITSGSLANGEKLVVLGINFSFGENPLPDVGEYLVTSNNYRIQKADGTETTSNYMVTGTSGNIKITRRPITLTSEGNDWTYDGYAHFEEGFTRTGTLAAATHEVIATHVTEVTDYTAGTDNVLSYAIYDGSNPVTGNYDITTVCGKLKINKREITVQLNSYTVTYGDAVDYQGGDEEITSETKLADYEALTVRNARPECSALPDVGSYPITCTQAADQIKKADGTDSTGNYKITFVNGTMTVTKRAITITSIGNTWTYDGAAHFEEGNVITVGGRASASHSVGVTSHTEVTDYNGEEGTDNVLTYEIYEGNRKVTENYDITTLFDKLYILKRAITVTLNSFEVTYGDNIVYPEGGETVDWAQFKALGHTVEVGSVNLPDAAFPDAGEYDITCSEEDVRILSGVRDVTFNYGITVKAGTLTVKPRPLTITTGGGEWEYDGNEYANEYYSADGLADGQNISVISHTRVKNVIGSGDNVLYYSIVSGGVPVNKANYAITEEWGTLTITPRLLKLISGGDSRPYNGDPLTCGEYSIIYFGNNAAQTAENAFIGGDSPEIGALPEITDFGTKENAITVTVSENYEITAHEYGTLEITKCEITVKLKDITVDYGDDYAYPTGAGNYEYVTNFIPGETLEITGVTFGFTGSYPAAGTYAITKPAACKILKANGRDGSDNNYTVTFVDGTLTVNKREIILAPEEHVRFAYGDDKYYGEDYAKLFAEKIVDVELPYGEKLVLTVGFTQNDLPVDEPKNTGVYGVTVAGYEILNSASGTSAADNYDIKISDDTSMRIDNRLLEVIPTFVSAVYGDTFAYPSGNTNFEYTPVSSREKYNLPQYDEQLEIFVNYLLNNQTTPSVGSYNIEISYVEVHYPDGSSVSAGLDWESDWYVAFNVGGYRVLCEKQNFANKLEITQREVSVQLYDMPDTVYGEPVIYCGDLILTNGLDGHEAKIDPDKIIYVPLIFIDDLHSGYSTYNSGLNEDLLCVGDYWIDCNIEDIKIYSGSEDVTGNYKIALTPSGTLTVNARPITLQLKYAEGFSVPYGDEIPAPEIITKGVGDLEEGLVYGDTITCEFIYENTKTGTKFSYFSGYNYLPAGEYLVYLDLNSYKITDNNGVYLTTKNYDIDKNTVPAELTVAKREITVTLKDFSITYGDPILAADKFILWLATGSNNPSILKGDIYDYIDLEGSFAEGETISQFWWRFSEAYHGPDDYAANCQQIDIKAGNTKIETIYTIVRDVESNYKVTVVDPATITVNPRPLTVTLGDITETYGNEITYKGGEVAEGNLSGHTVWLNADAEWQFTPAGDYAYPSAGDYTYTCDDTYITVKDGSGNDVTFNYDITVVEGNLTINKREITVTLYEIAGAVYGEGDKLSYGEYIGNYANAPDFAYNEDLQISISWLYNNTMVAAPFNAGDYKYQIDYYASKIFDKDGNKVENGLNNYLIICEAGTVTVDPLPINFEVKSGSKTYDGMPYVYPVGVDNFNPLPLFTGELPYGEHIEISVTYEDENGNTVTNPTDAGTYTIHFKGIASLIEDENPDAVPENYEFQGFPSILEIEKRDLEIGIIEGVEFIYSVDEIDTHKLFYATGFPEDEDGVVSDKISWFASMWLFSEDGENWTEEEPVNAGTYYVVVTFALVTYDGGRHHVNVEKNHNVTYKAGTFKITPLELHLVTNDGEWEYDGTEHRETGFKLYYTAADGELKEFDFDGEIEAISSTPITDYSESGKENVVTYDFSKTNYTVPEGNISYGTLNITKREVTLVTESETWVYDGDEHFKESGTVLNEVESHNYDDITWRDRVTDAGEYKNYGAINKITDADGNDVTENYEIKDTQPGTLLITPRPIVVVRENAVKDEYDGKALTCTEVVETYYEDGDGNRHRGLLSEEDTVYPVAGTVTELYRATTVDNQTQFTASSENYTVIRCEGGTLTVYPKEITVYLSKLTVEYGKTYPVDDYDNYDLALSDSLADGDKLLVSISELAEMKNVGTYAVKADEEDCYVATSYDGENGLENYVITFIDGELTITVKKIDVQLYSDLNTVYGEPYAYPARVNNFENADELAYGETLEVKVKYTDKAGNVVNPADLTPVGEYTVEIVDYVIRDGNGTTIDGGNYEVNTSGLSTFTVDPRPLTVVTGGGEWTYDGVYHSNTDFVSTYYGTADKAGVLEGDENVLSYVEGSANSVINANCKTFAEDGTPNTAEFVSLSPNYEVAGYVQGSLKIKQVEITVILKALDSVDYSGKPVTYVSGADNFDYAPGSGRVIEGEELTVGVTFYDAYGNVATPLNAADYHYKLDLSGSSVANSKGGLENGVSNYDIHCEDVIYFTVRKLSVLISLNPWTAITYDGNEQYFDTNGYNIEEGSFAEGESLSVAVDYFKEEDRSPVSPAPRNAGNYVAVFNSGNSTVNGLSSTVNYDIKIKDDEDEISFTILRKNITISMGEEERAYNGAAYDYVSEKENFYAVGAVTGETIVPEVVYRDINGVEIPSPVNAGSYSVVYTSFKVEGANDVAENYNLVTDIGSLTCPLKIGKRDVTVEVISRTIEVPEDTSTPLDGENFYDDFVGNDRDGVEYYYTYSKDGSAVTEVATKGEYAVEITITGNALILNNYDITAKAGKLTVTARQVGVRPVYNGAEAVYNGSEIDPAEFFGYEDWHITVPSEKGFKNGDDPAPRYVFTDEDGNVTYAPVDAGDYTVTVEFPEASADDYWIYSEEVVFTIKPCHIIVDFSGFDVSKLNGYLTYNHTVLPEDLITVSTSGIYERDADEIRWYYYNPAYGEITYNYAGAYTLLAGLDNASGNYVIENPVLIENAFEVARVTLYIVPEDSSAKYSSANQTLRVNSYDIIYGSLVEGDSVTYFSATGVLQVPSPIKVVTLASVTIMHGSENVTDCYDLHFEYAADNDVDNSQGYTRETFRATLAFEKRTIYYTQLVPDVTVMPYSGSAIVPTKDGAAITVNTPRLFEITGGEGFVQGDAVSVRMIAPILMPGTIEKWVVLKVTNQQGKDVTALYNFVLENADASAITVEGYPLSFDFSIDKDGLQRAWDENDASMLQAWDLNSNYRVLDESFYTVTGKPEAYVLKVLVTEENASLAVKVILYEENGSSLVDKSMYYGIASAEGIEDLKLVQYRILTISTTN